MRSSYFVASRSSRHRTAALALYRALLRAGSAVPMPPEPLFDLPIHPVARIVRKRFASNRTTTSLRLLYASMAAGYNFLTVLVKAQTPGSPEHAKVVGHVRSRLETVKASLAAHPPRPPRRERARGSGILTNVAAPGEPPSYISTTKPEPLSSLTRPRHVPTLGFTSEFQTFLRYRKPQPWSLSQELLRHRRAHGDRIQKTKDVEDFVLQYAVWEDEWDETVADLARREGLQPAEAADEDSFKVSYAWSTMLSKLWWELLQEVAWEDWTARGVALHRILDEERALAAQEQGETPAPMPPPTNPTPFVLRNADKAARLSVPRRPQLPLITRLRLEDPDKTWTKSIQDPWWHPAWGLLVDSQKGKLVKWLGYFTDSGSPRPEDAWKKSRSP